MKTVTVKKDQLKGTLEENKTTHIKDFEIAWDAYVVKAKENLERILKALKKAQRGEDVELYVGLSAPVNHAEDYERALGMLEWEVGDEVELTESEFRQFVQDEWGWTAATRMSNTMYTGSESPSKLTVKKRK